MRCPGKVPWLSPPVTNQRGGCPYSPRPCAGGRFSDSFASRLLNLQTGRCDVVVYDAPALGTLKARAPDRYGAFVGVIETGESYGIAVPKGSTLLGPVDKSLAVLVADGTVARLAKKRLTVDPAALRPLR